MRSAGVQALRARNRESRLHPVVAAPLAVAGRKQGEFDRNDVATLNRLLAF